MNADRIGRWPLGLLLGLTLVAGGRAGEAPLRLPGSTVLYQRVLTTPGATVAVNPGAAEGRMLAALSRLYVYERRNLDGREWLRLGTDPAGRNLLGWVPAAQTVAWNQQLTLALTNPAGRERLVFFRGREDLRSVLDAPDPGAAVRAIVQGVADGRADPRVAALEPETFVNLNERFYLLPILEVQDALDRTNRPVRALKVASVTRPAGPDAAPPDAASAPDARPAPQSASPATPGDEIRAFRAAVVFVIDSTVSMGPYIEETRAAVTRFYDRIRDAGLLDRVAFGLVAFRAKSADAATDERLGYVARVFAAPTEVRNGDEFLSRIRDLKEAPVSTDHFDEDPYAGLMAALEMPDWRGRFDARHLILITDAGALDGTHNAPPGTRATAGAAVAGVDSQTGLDAAGVQRVAQDRSRGEVAISVMHLETPAARAAGDLARAAGQYRELAQNPMNQQVAYFPIAGGDPRRFRAAIDTYAQTVIDQIGETAAGRLSTPDAAARAALRAGTDGSGAADRDPRERIRAIAASLGHAMQLAYLGERRQTAAPEVFEAWITDTDPADPSLKTVEVRVLLTRDELSDLKELVAQVIDAAEAEIDGTASTQAFYDRLASIAAAFERDPKATGRAGATELARRDLLMEYLAGLPYRSDVLDLKRSDWTSWGVQRQADFVDRLRKKVLLYARYYGDLSGWIDIAQADNPRYREPVYPIPLKDLP